MKYLVMVRKKGAMLHLRNATNDVCDALERLTEAISSEAWDSGAVYVRLEEKSRSKEVRRG